MSKRSLLLAIVMWSMLAYSNWLTYQLPEPGLWPIVDMAMTGVSAITTAMFIRR